MAGKKEEIIKKLTKKYYLQLTEECIELSPKLEDSFELRNAVINNLKKEVKYG
jgi:hypothetical protein